MIVGLGGGISMLENGKKRERKKSKKAATLRGSRQQTKIKKASLRINTVMKKG